MEIRLYTRFFSEHLDATIEIRIAMVGFAAVFKLDHEPMKRRLLMAAAVAVVVTGAIAAQGADTGKAAYRGAPATPKIGWSEINPNAPWGGRAGLQVVDLAGSFYLMGGRTPNPPSFPPIPGDSKIWSDVWRSDDRGRTWEQILQDGASDSWPARAYFGAVRKDGALYVLGGQDFSVVPNACPPFVPACPPFVSASRFFNDVWTSGDGTNWQQLTAHAGWAGRAGLSTEVLNGEIYVFAGSFNDDSAVIGGPPNRQYFNDVWKSSDGRTWTRALEHAPWAPRAGAATVVKDGWIYLLGGEDGFTCAPLPNCEAPYFNDVWRTRDGAHWQRMTAAAEWAARPGHKCVVGVDAIVCFGGFGLLSNPVDMWVSRDGTRWKRLPFAPWGATSPNDIKYDFAAVSVRGLSGLRTQIFTFGGDRETFDFTDPENYLRVDADVWRFGLNW
jgi:hypothetical protein